MPDPTPIPNDALDLDALMDLATPLLREAFDEMPPEQAAVTALGRRIRAEVERIYVAGRTAAAADIRAEIVDEPAHENLRMMNAAFALAARVAENGADHARD